MRWGMRPVRCFVASPGARRRSSARMTSLTGFAGGRAAGHFAGRLRLFALSAALLAVAGGIATSVGGSGAADLHIRRERLLWLLILAAIAAIVPVWALFRNNDSATKLEAERHAGAWSTALVLDEGIPAPLAPIGKLVTYLEDRSTETAPLHPVESAGGRTGAPL